MRPGERAEADEGADVDHGEHDRGVEDVAAPVVPRLDVAPPLAPYEEEEEGDREEERDLQEAADGREHRLRREHDDDERDQPDDQEATYRRVLGEEAPHAGHVAECSHSERRRESKEVPANQSSRFGP